MKILAVLLLLALDCSQGMLLSFDIQKFKGYGVQKYNFACCFVWV
jgi:hypothetical protein